MEHWELAAKEAKEKKELLTKFPYLGKKVRREGLTDWEEGIVVISRFDDSSDDEEFIQYAPDDLEQLIGLPFQVWDEKTNTWIDEVWDINYKR